MGGGKVIVKADKDSIIRQAKQAANSLSANNYGNELAKETEKLKGQGAGIGTYSLSNRYGPEHAGLAAFWLYAQGRAELAVELHDADGGKEVCPDGQ